MHTQLILSTVPHFSMLRGTWNTYVKPLNEKYKIEYRNLGKVDIRQKAEKGELWSKGFPGSSVGKQFACNAGHPSSIPGSGRSPGDTVRLPSPVFSGFPCSSAGKESACHTGDLGSIPGLGRSPGEGKGYPFQCFGLENPMDCIVMGLQSQIQLSNFLFTWRKTF